MAAGASALALSGCGADHQPRGLPARPCSATQLSATGGWQGATGTMLGVIILGNRGPSPCALQGYVGVALLDAQGHALAVRVQHRGTIGDAGLDGPVVTRPVVLRAKTRVSAAIGLRWSNWCGPEPGSDGVVGVEITVDGSRLAVPPGGNWAVPSCRRATEPSVLEEGPVQAPVA